MNVLMESPIEALAFGYIGYYNVLNIVSNCWTWIAVITTAALSFWRIKATRAASIPPLLCIPLDEDDHDHDHDQVEVQTASTSSLVNCRFSELEMDVATKGKLTVYYNDEGENTEGKLTVREWGCGKSTDDLSVSVSAGGDLWEKVLRIRSGEMSWYRYQDLTVINGNVVRLWENERYYSYSSSFAVW